MVETRTATSVDELPEIAKWIIARTGPGIILFEGEMGAGKTTLIKAICRELEVEDEVNSPTFSLVNEYLSARHGPVYHFDFYRIEDEAEAMDIGIEEYLYSGQFCLLEWPENICNLLPDDCATVRITTTESGRCFELNFNHNE